MHIQVLYPALNRAPVSRAAVSSLSVRPVHDLLEYEVFTECDLVLPLSISIILSSS